MTPTIQATSASELRARIVEIRQELAAATQQYQVAKKQGQGELVISLLRKKSNLIRKLFQTQSELLLALRNGSSD